MAELDGGFGMLLSPVPAATHLGWTAARVRCTTRVASGPWYEAGRLKAWCKESEKNNELAWVTMKAKFQAAGI